MVTGRVPFEGEAGMAVAFKHLSEPLIPPRTINPSLSPAVDRVIGKALAKNRDLRYGSVDEFVSAFREAVERGTIDRTSETTAIVAEALRHPTIARGVQVRPTPPPAPIPLEVIWPSEPEESPRRGGSGWALLATIAGALIGSFILFWGLAAGLNALLGRLP